MWTTTLLVIVASSFLAQGANLGSSVVTKDNSNKPQFADSFQQTKHRNVSCECGKEDCICCALVSDQKLSLNNTVCIAAEVGFLKFLNIFALQWDDETLFTTLGLDMFLDDLDLCTGIPGKSDGYVCIHMSNNDDYTKICINLQVFDQFTSVMDLRVGCVDSYLPEEVKAQIKLKSHRTSRVMQNLSQRVTKISQK